MNDIDNLQTALEAGEKLAALEPRLDVVVDPNDPTEARKVLVGLIEDDGGKRIAVLDDAMEAFEKMAPGPRRREGTVTLTDEESFIAFVNRWGSPATVIYADTSNLGFVAVLDDHPAGDDLAAAHWRRHRATYACPRDPAWKAWVTHDGVALPQTVFADFIESRLEDLVKAEGCAAPLDVLQMARQLTIRTSGTYQREINPTTGDSILVNKTQTETGSTVIPRAFAIAIPVFEGGERYQIEARVRFGFVEGSPRFSYTLHRRKEIERDAFNAVRRNIDGATGRMVLAGTPG